jgi:hypothetical protein
MPGRPHRGPVVTPTSPRRFRRSAIAVITAVGLAVGGVIAVVMSRSGPAAASTGVVQPGQVLTAGQQPITSPGGDYRLFMAANGQLVEESVYGIMPIVVEYFPDRTSFSTGGNTSGGTRGPARTTQIWEVPARASSGARAVMQTDGNLVVYSADGQVRWASGTAGHPGSHLSLQDDANIVIYDSARRALWASRTVSIVEADAPATGANLRSCPWPEAPAADYQCLGPTLANGTSVTMLCWLSTPTPSKYGNYPSNKWFYLTVDTGPSAGTRGFIHSSLIAQNSQIATPGCIMTGTPTAPSAPRPGPTHTPPGPHSPSSGPGGRSTGGTSAGAGSGGGAGGSVSLAQGPAAPAGYRYAVSLSGFPQHSPVSVECFDSVSPRGFYVFSLRTDSSGSAFTDSECYSGDGPQHWVTADGIRSNEVAWSDSSAPPPPPPAPPAALDADATPAFGTCPSNPPPANEVYCGGWSNSCHTPSFSKSNCPTYVSQGTTVDPVCWTTGQMINNSYSAAAPGAHATLQSDIWIKVSNYLSSPWMNELWFNPDNTASNNLQHC